MKGRYFFLKWWQIQLWDRAETACCSVASRVWPDFITKENKVLLASFFEKLKIEVRQCESVVMKPIMY